VQHTITSRAASGRGAGPDAELPLLPEESAPLGGGGGERGGGGGGLWRGLWSDVAAFGALLASSWLNLLLLCAPLALAARLAGWGAPATFLLSFGALVPLGMLLGELTEDVGRRSGPVRAAGGRRRIALRSLAPTYRPPASPHTRRSPHPRVADRRRPAERVAGQRHGNHPVAGGAGQGADRRRPDVAAGVDPGQPAAGDG